MTIKIICYLGALVQISVSIRDYFDYVTIAETSLKTPNKFVLEKFEFLIHRQVIEYDPKGLYAKGGRDFKSIFMRMDLFEFEIKMPSKKYNKIYERKIRKFIQQLEDNNGMMITALFNFD